MIRVDLGKDDTQKTPRRSFVVFKNLFGKKEKIQSTEEGAWKENAVVLLFFAMAVIPHFFVSQYKHFVEKNHTVTMAELNLKQETFEAKVTQLRSFQKEMESFELQKKKIKDRLQFISRLLELREAPVNVLDTLGQSLPAKAWLAEMEFQVSPKPFVTVKGKAYANEDISDYVDKLSESVYVQDVTLAEMSTQVDGKNGGMRKFEVKMTPKGSFILPEEREVASVTESGVEIPPPVVNRSGAEEPLRLQQK